MSPRCESSLQTRRERHQPRIWPALSSEVLGHDPFTGVAFVFRNRPATALKVLVYDGQGFWLCHKRLSSGRFGWWPTEETAASTTLAAHQLHVLLSAGNPEGAKALADWRPVGPRS